MEKGCLKTLKHIDCFAGKISFNINKNSIYKTKTGGVFSLFYFIIVFIMSFILGKSFYYRTDPIVLEQAINLNHHVMRQIRAENLTLAFRIEDENGNYISINNTLNIKAYYRVLELDNSINNYKPPIDEKIDIKPCSSSEFDDVQINNLNKSKWLCMDLNSIKNNNITLGGYYYESPVYSYLIFEVSSCSSKVFNKTNCSDFASIKKITEGKYLTLLYSKTTFNYEKEDPMTSFYYNHIIALDPSIKREGYVYFQYGNFTDDDGIISRTEETREFISFDSFVLDHISVDKEKYEKEEVDLIWLGISLQKSVIKNKRRFWKIQDVLAILGGFISIVKIVLGTAHSFFYEFELKKFFIDKFWQQTLCDIKFNKNNYVNMSKNSFTAPLNESKAVNESVRTAKKSDVESKPLADINKNNFTAYTLNIHKNRAKIYEKIYNKVYINENFINNNSSRIDNQVASNSNNDISIAKSIKRLSGFPQINLHEKRIKEDINLEENDQNSIKCIDNNLTKINNQEKKEESMRIKIQMLKERKYFEDKEIKNKFNNSFSFSDYIFKKIFCKTQKSPCIEIYDDIFETYFIRALDVLEYIKIYNEFINKEYINNP